MLNQKEWWKKSVVYQIYPKSFKDSNRDGIGDIKGIIEKLDYLKDLGVDVLWLCPVYQSPMDDGGYDISDYYKVDSMFGTNEDLDLLIQKAAERDMKILMDLVVNHTSDEHEWFQKAQKDPNGKYANYYIFRQGVDGNPPNNWRSYFGSPAWEQVGESDMYYLHAFSKKQPDLNWENEELREEIYKMVNYWLDKGIGGFRIDAICNIKKNIQTGRFTADGEDGLCFVGNGILNQPGIETFLSELNERTFKPHNSMTVAEANVPDHLLKQFIGADGFFSMVFDFSYTDLDVPETGEWFKPVKWDVKTLKNKIFHSQLETQEIGWGALYLENHDQPRSLNKYLLEEEINDYSTTMLATLFMMLRGTPFIYQGQEIGMSNIKMEHIREYNDLATYDQYKRAILAGYSPSEALEIMNKRSRDHSRTPMQWDNSKNAGFTDIDETWLKVNPNYKEKNVKDQTRDINSVLNYYKKLIALRKASKYHKLLIEGKFVPCFVEDDSVIAYKHVYKEQELFIINNFKNGEKQVLLEAKDREILLNNYDSIQMKNGTCNLRPFESIIMIQSSSMIE